jgi:hypothetical protein
MTGILSLRGGSVRAILNWERLHQNYTVSQKSHKKTILFEMVISIVFIVFR